MLKNPKGKWITMGLDSYHFVHPGYATYGRVYVRHDSLMPNLFTWFWEARVLLCARDGGKPITGYAATEEQAKRIVEDLLWETDTVEKGLLE